MSPPAAARLEAVLLAGGELLLSLLLGLDLLLGQVLVLVAEVGLVEDQRLGLSLALRRRAGGELGIDQGRLLAGRLRALRLRLFRGAVAALLREPARPALGLALLRLLAITGQAD